MLLCFKVLGFLCWVRVPGRAHDEPDGGSEAVRAKFSQKA